MANVAVVGSQWGDEGKGKIVDWLSERADVVVRFQGGHNAGHTLVDRQPDLQAVAAAVGRGAPGKLSIIGNGVVVDPWALFEEIERIESQGVAIDAGQPAGRRERGADPAAPRRLDRAREEPRGERARSARPGAASGRPMRTRWRAARIRVCDLADQATWPHKVDDAAAAPRRAAPRHGRRQPVDRDAPDRQPACEIAPQTAALSPSRSGGGSTRRAGAGARILFEGAQGALLDVDHGTYPLSPRPTPWPAQAAAGAGMGPGAHRLRAGHHQGLHDPGRRRAVPDRAVDNEIGQPLGERGHEFGTVTGRPRRCGWFDAVLVRQAIKVGGIDGIALTKLDVLDGIADAQGLHRLSLPRRHARPPAGRAPRAGRRRADLRDPGRLERKHPGRALLGRAAGHRIKYVRRIEELIGAPVALLSTSPQRDDTIL